MKLVRFGQPGSEKPGLVGTDSVLRDLSSVIPDIGPATLSPTALKAISEVALSSLPAVEGQPRFGVPVSGIGKFVAIGLNYSDHAAEANLPIPSEPIIFQKAITSLSGPNDPVMLPQGSKKGD